MTQLHKLYFKHLLVIFSLVIVSSQSYGQLNEVDQKLESCLKEIDKSSVQLICIEEAMKQYELKIDELYTKIVSTVRNKRLRKQFVQAHKSWTRFKDKEFKLIEQYSDNPALINNYNVITNHFKLQLLKERTSKLLDYNKVINL